MSWVRAAGVPSGCRAGAEASRQEESVHVMKDEGMTEYAALKFWRKLEKERSSH